MPTPNQIIAVKKLSEIVGRAKNQKGITLGKILKEAGYSDSVCKTPKRVTDRKGFKELLNETMMGERLMERHEVLLDSFVLDTYRMDARLTDKEIEDIVEGMRGCKVRSIKRYKGESSVTVMFYRPDNLSIDKALDKAYKLLGYYAAEKHDVGGNLGIIKIVNYGDKKNGNK